MIIQMIRQLNPEHEFFIPYLQPAKHSIAAKIKSGELKQQDLVLVDFVLPKEAEVLIGQDGHESISVDGHGCEIVTCAFTSRCWLLNSQHNIRIGIDRRIEGKSEIIQFPINNANRAV